MEYYVYYREGNILAALFDQGYGDDDTFAQNQHHQQNYHENNGTSNGQIEPCVLLLQQWIRKFADVGDNRGLRCWMILKVDVPRGAVICDWKGIWIKSFNILKNLKMTNFDKWTSFF